MILNNLNEKQRNSVLSENKRVLVLAGAGSGKTNEGRHEGLAFR